MEKTKFLPYLLKRVIFYLITMILIIAVFVAFRVHKENNTCINNLIYHGCYTPGGCYKHGFH